MARYLFVVPPLVGHVNPAAGVAEELQRRGHEVAWVAHEVVVGPIVGNGSKIYPAGDRFLTDVVEHLADHDRLKGPAALKFLWEKVLIPLALDMVEPVRAAVDDFQPDAMMSDQQAFAGSIVASSRDLVWAVSACSTAELVDPLAGLPKIAEWRKRQLHGLYAELGLDSLVATSFDPRHTPYLLLQYSTPELVGPADYDPGTTAFVGPVLPRWAESAPFPWDWLERHQANVLVTLGTLSQDEGDRFLNAVVEAVTDKSYGVVIVGSPGSRDTPGNVLWRPFVPQLELLPRVQAVVCHAGHNTTVGALSLGVPLVCAPIREDQPITADQVARSGAGRRISFWRSRPGEIAEAIDAVLTDPSHRAAAGRIAESFHAAGGASTAADRLEGLLSKGESGGASQTSA